MTVCTINAAESELGYVNYGVLKVRTTTISNLY